MAEGVAARAAAVDLLTAVLGEGRMMSDLPEPDLPPGERARAVRLATEVLRRIEPADRRLGAQMRKAPPLPVLNALRLAVVEMALGAAAHGVVNAAVAIVRANRRTQHLAGLVNAVLRAMPADPLDGVQKMPRWMRQPAVHAFGRDAVAAIEAAHALAPPLDLTLRPGAIAPDGDVLPTGTLRLAAGTQVSALAGYAEGGWWVQDAAAALAVPLLAPRPQERVLDLCAAPGGKTLQLAAAGAQVTALDISPVRMKRIEDNLARTGLKATCVVADALDWQPADGALFDAVLLDAPCSATGTVRRHPDLPFVKDGSELAGLVDLQARLLDRALTLVRPGGRVVFVTCSLLPDEGEAQLASALSRHPGLMAERHDLTGVDPSWWTGANGLRLRPDHWADRGGMDGFFMARLRVPGGA